MKVVLQFSDRRGYRKEIESRSLATFVLFQILQHVVFIYIKLVPPSPPLFSLFPRLGPIPHFPSSICKRYALEVAVRSVPSL